VTGIDGCFADLGALMAYVSTRALQHSPAQLLAVSARICRELGVSELTPALVQQPPPYTPDPDVHPTPEAYYASYRRPHGWESPMHTPQLAFSVAEVERLCVRRPRPPKKKKKKSPPPDSGSDLEGLLLESDENLPADERVIGIPGRVARVDPMRPIAHVMPSKRPPASQWFAIGSTLCRLETFSSP